MSPDEQPLDVQTPFIGLGAEQDAVVPPADPRQFQRYSVLVSAISCKDPMVQLFTPDPHCPLIALQLGIVQASVRAILILPHPSLS